MNKFSLMGNGLDNLFGAYNMGHNDELYNLIIFNVIDMLQFLYTKARYAIGFNNDYSSFSVHLSFRRELI